MINRDFTKSNKQYIKQNKMILISLALILILGLVITCIFGFKGGTDIEGCNTFSINIGTEYDAEKLDTYTSNINTLLNEHKAELKSVQITGEGSETTLVVKYSGDIKNIVNFNVDVSNTFNLTYLAVSQHSAIGASVTTKDYVYTIAAGLIILALASVYISIKYNLACAITAMAGSTLGVMLLLALTSLFRLTINSSFLAINIITLLLILAEGLIMFDSLEKERAKLKDKNERSAQLNNALQANAFRQKLTYGAIFAIALVAIILMPNTIKEASLIALFATVVTMFVTVYALPFVWCLTIGQVSDKIRVKKVENTKSKQTIEQVEGELEQGYTENQVIEVKEDDGNTPSNDDNITIE